MVMLPTNIPAIQGAIHESQAMIRSSQATSRQTCRDRAASFVAALYFMRNAERQADLYQKTILPLAEPVEYITPGTVFELHCRIYGTPRKPVRLFEDNSYTFDFEKGEYNWVNLSWDGDKIQVARTGSYKGRRYKVDSRVMREER
jgi:hypothetical protein